MIESTSSKTQAPNLQADSTIDRPQPIHPESPALCHVLHTLNVGGAEILAKQFAEHFASKTRVVFVCLDELGEMGQQMRSEGFVVEVLDRQPGFDVGCVRRLASFLREQNVEIVHAHQYAPFFYASFSRFFGPRVPIVFTEHGRDYPDRRRWKRVLANKLLFHRRDRVIAVGGHVRGALVDNEGFPNPRVQVIYNGVDVSRYRPAPESRISMRESLGLPNETVAIMQVARLNRLKDHGTALRAVQVAKEMGAPIHLFLVGDGEERDSIESMIVDYGLNDSVTLLGTRDNVPELLLAADVFMLSSVSEGIPLTLIEAMLVGLPCVATRAGGVPEVVADGVTGFTCDVADGDTLGGLLATLASDAAQRVAMGKAGRDRAIATFNDRSMFEQYDRLYQELRG